MRFTDRFRIGSVTKTFVATVVLETVVEGRVGLEDSVEHWLPRLLLNGRGSQSGSCLATRSGLFDYTDDRRVFQPYWSQPRFVWTPRRLIALAASDPVRLHPTRLAIRVFEHGTTSSWGSSSSARLERRSADSYESASSGHSGSTTRPSSRDRGRRSARRTGFRVPSHDGVVSANAAVTDTSAYSASWMWAAGGIVSSADDLARFFAALLGGRVLAPGLLQTMETTPPPGRYGLGLAVFQTRCGRAWGHTGNALGYVTVVWNTKDGLRQIVLMVNSYPFSAGTDSVVRRVLESRSATNQEGPRLLEAG